MSCHCHSRPACTTDANGSLWLCAHIRNAKSSWRIKCLAVARSRQYSFEVHCTRKHRFWCDAKVHCHIKPLQWDGASCLGFLVTQRQCWQRLWGFPSLNVTFSSACLLQYLSAELTAHYCTWRCAWRQNVPSVLSFPYRFCCPVKPPCSRLWWFSSLEALALKGALSKNWPPVQSILQWSQVELQRLAN